MLGTISLFANSSAVCAIKRCCSVKSSGVHTSAGVRSSIRKLPPAILILGSAVIVAIDRSSRSGWKKRLAVRLRNRGFVGCPVSLSQLSFQEFARTCFGEALQELDRVWALVVGQMRATELDQFRGACLRSQFQDNQGFGRLAPLLIGNWDYDYLVHGRVSQKNLFHFQGRDVFAPADDDVFLAIHNAEVVAVIDGGDVAGMKPTTGHGRARGIGLPPVAIHDDVPSHSDLAHGCGIMRYFIPVTIDHPKLHSWNRKPRHSLAKIALLAVPLGIRLRG